MHSELTRKHGKTTNFEKKISNEYIGLFGYISPHFFQDIEFLYQNLSEMT